MRPLYSIYWKNSGLDNRSVVAIIGIDLSKAFDSLPRDLLLAKLATYGLSSNACSLIRDYLTDHFQRVRLGDKLSDWNPLSTGAFHRGLYWVLSFLIFFLTIYNLLGFNPSSVHMLMIHNF